MESIFFKIAKPVVLFITSFFFIYYIVDPELIYFNQQPLFFFDFYNINQHLQYPGGILEMLSVFLSQFYKFKFVSSLIVSLLIILLYIGCDILAKQLKLHALISFIIPLSVLFLFFNYDYPLSSILGIVSTVFLCVLIFIVEKIKDASKFAFILILILLFYYISCSYALIGLLIWFVESIARSKGNNIIIKAILLLICLLVPFLAYKYTFNILLPDAYLKLLPFHTNWEIKYMPFVHFAIFPLVILLNIIVSRKIQTFIYSTVLAVLAITAFYSYDSEKKSFISIKFSAFQHNWDKVIETGNYRIEKGFDKDVFDEENYFKSTLITSLINKALYHKGLLPQTMFSYPQTWGNDGLFNNRILDGPEALFTGDLFMEMNYINASQKYLYESVSSQGNTPFNIYYLGKANILKGDIDGANRCIAILEKSIAHKNEAKELTQVFRKCLAPCQEKTDVENSTPDNQYFMNFEEIEWDLIRLLEKNKANKMAFEYLMTSYLLENKLGAFISNLKYLKNFNYPTIPKHFQEAIIIYNEIRKKAPLSFKEYPVSLEVINNFKEYNKTRMAFKNNPEQMEKELQIKFHETYWFYAMFRGIKNNRLSVELKLKKKSYFN